MKHIPITRHLIESWAGKSVFKDGMKLFERGVVENVVYAHPFVTGQLAIGLRGMRCKFELVENGLVENHCPCRENREEARICLHLVALALEALRLYSDPERVDKMEEEKRRAERLEAYDDSAYHTRAPDGIPATLRITLKQSWCDNLSNNEVPLRCAVETAKGTIPLNEFPKQTALALSNADENLLFVIEDICEGPAKGRFNASTADFINILELCVNKPLYEGGRDDYLLIDCETINPHLRLKLDESTGELILSLQTENHESSLYVVSGSTGWALQAGIFRKLKAVLPGPLRAVYTAPVRISRNQVPGFLQNELPRLSSMIQVESNVSADMLSLTPAQPRFRLHLEGTQIALSATLYADYGSTQRIAGRDEGADLLSIPADDDLLGFQTRNPAVEQTALELLGSLGFRGRRGDMLTSIRGERDVLNFLGSKLPFLTRQGWRIELEGMVSAFMEQTDHATAVVQISHTNQGFFDVGYRYEDLKGSSLNESEIQRAINMGNAFIERPGRTILIDTDAIKTARGVFSDCSAGEGGQPGTFRMNNIHSAYVQSSLHALDGIDVDADADWLTKAKTQNRETSVQPLPLGSLDAVLRDYQKQGVYWLDFLERSGFCGILADEMGLGKTLQTLTWLQLNGKTKGPSLIVCPTSLVENWAEEAKKFTPDLRVQIMHGSDRHDHWDDVARSDLVITSYALIRRDLDQYLQHEFAAAVLDEAQNIKNRTTQNAEAVKQIRARQRLVLTGTPVENSVADLWSIMDFLMPGYLGSHQKFRENYELPIRDGGLDGELAQQKLRRKLHPFLLRRRKKEVAKDLPDKIQRIAYCTLSSDQAKVYKKLAESAQREITGMVNAQGFNKSRMQILKLLLQLRQTCCHLSLLKLPGLNSQFPSAKLELFLELVDEALDAGHRILVFSQFTSMLAILREELDARELKYCYLDGATQDRQARVRQFNTDRSIPLFLISLKAGGTGLNLTGADMVIHFDPWWNPAVEDQATDRAHRIGQKKTVYNVKLITKGTIEEKVLHMQQNKQRVIDATLGQDGAFEQQLDWKAIQDLIAL